MNENLINSLSTIDDKDEINPIEESGNNKKNEALILNRKIINEISGILSNHKKNKEKEEIACEELLKYINDNKINIGEIKEGDNSTIIQKYCNDGEDYYLKCMLLCLEKLMDENSMTQYMLNEDVSNMNIFEISCELGDIKIFRALKKYIKDNQSILQKLINNNQSGKTNIFHIAADKGKIISLLFFYSFYYNKSNSCLNLKNQSEMTPLHIACYRGNYEFVQYLVDLGADINCTDKDNKTPFFYAIRSNNNKIIKYLILQGANKKIKDKSNKIAIETTNDKNAIDILEDKSIFDIAFKCKTQYESLKNHKRNIYMLILLTFMIILHLFLIIKYKSTNFLQECYPQVNFSFELILLVLNIITQFLGICIYVFFQFIKKKKKIIDDNRFLIVENGIEYYEMFKYNENICVKCKRVKEITTQHCIACDICIDRFDHHCFFLNACIHHYNKKYFYIFLFEILATVFLNFMTSFKFFVDFIKYPKMYYGIIKNECNFENNGFYDFIIYTLDILYIFLTLFVILTSIMPFIFDLVSKYSKKREKIASNENPNRPLLPVEESKV